VDGAAGTLVYRLGGNSGRRSAILPLAQATPRVHRMTWRLGLCDSLCSFWF